MRFYAKCCGIFHFIVVAVIALQRCAQLLPYNVVQCTFVVVLNFFCAPFY